MKAVFLTMILAGLGLLYACGGSNTPEPEPEPEDPFFKADVAGTRWEMGVKEAYYANYADVFNYYRSSFLSDFTATGLSRQVYVNIWEDRLNRVYTPAGEPYTADPHYGPFGGAQLALTGYGTNFNDYYITRYCANRDYKIEIVELDEKNKRIRIKFEGKLCSEDGTDSVRVTNGECWATYE